MKHRHRDPAEPRSDTGGAECPRPSRRGFLERALAAGSAVWTAGVLAPAAAYLWPARSRGPTRKSIEVDPASVASGTGRVLHEGGKPILLLHLASGEFRAFSAVCPHLGCIVHWDAERARILCPCHAGVFAPDGSVVSGPPPRALASYPTRLAAEHLRIET